MKRSKSVGKVISILLLSIIALLMMFHWKRVLLGQTQKQAGLQSVAKRWNRRYAPILMPICGRPKYLRQVMHNLALCDLITETIVVVSSDCANEEVDRILDEWPYKNRLILLDHWKPYFGIPTFFVQHNEYATAANIKYLLDYAFVDMKAEYAVVVESDIVPSKDFLAFHHWAYRHFGNNATVLSVGSFSMDSTAESPLYEFKETEFSSWGWSVSAPMYHGFVDPNWTWFSFWDGILDRKRIELGRVSLSPRRSRVKNIGQHGENFKYSDDGMWQQSFGKVYIGNESVDYSTSPPIIVS